MQYSWLLYLVVCVLGAYPALMLATLLHEIGHAVFASLAGYRVTSIGLGYGKRFFTLHLPGGILFYICRSYPGFAFCWTISKELIIPRRREALRLIGGVAANFLAAILFFALRTQPQGWIWVALALFNLIVGLGNIVPIRSDNREGAIANDGVKLMRLLFSRRKLAEHPGMEIQFHETWREVGDTRALRYYLFRAALAARQFGSVEGAQQWLTEAEAFPPDESDAHLLLLSGYLAPQDSEKQLGLLEIATDEYRRIGSYSGVFVGMLAQYMYGPASKKVEIEPYLSTHPLSRRPETANQIAAAKLLLFIADTENRGNFAGIETLLARYEATRRQYRSDIQDSHVYFYVAHWRKQSGDETGALLTWEKAQKAMRDIAQTLAPHKEYVADYKRVLDEFALQHGFPPPFETRVMLKN